MAIDHTDIAVMDFHDVSRQFRITMFVKADVAGNTLKSNGF